MAKSSPEPLRVILATIFVPGLTLLAETVRGEGHQLVAALTCPPASAEAMQAALPDLDLLVPASRHELAAALAAYSPDLAVCFGFPWRIPLPALRSPRLGWLNCHPSLLPRYRGPNSVAWALRNQDDEIGLSVHLMSERFDSGPLLAQGSAALSDADDYTTIGGEKLPALLPPLLVEAITQLQAGAPGVAQDESRASYAGWFEDSYAEIDWHWPAEEIAAQVRAWSVPGLTRGGLRGPVATIGGRQALIRAARAVVNETKAAPGTVLAVEGRELTIACGVGAIHIADWRPV